MNQGKHAPIQTLCKIFKVSRSGYYEWLGHRPAPRERENAQLLKDIYDSFYHFKGIYGHRRIRMYINRTQGTNHSLQKIRRLMNILGLKAFIRRSNEHSTKKDKDAEVAANHLKRKFKADHPHQKLVTDVTHLRYGAGKKAYLCIFKDLYDGAIVTYNVSKNNDNPLVMETLKDYIKAYPEAKPLIHSDRGSQYTSKEYRRRTTQAEMQVSMSRVGKCIDNAPAETFFGHYKHEDYYFKQYTGYQALVDDIDQYMDFYNNHRYQEKLNCLAPSEFNARYQAAA